MKRIFLAVSMFIMSVLTYGQTSLLQEDFESLPLSFTSSGNGNWARSSQLKASGLYSDSATVVNANDTIKLTSASFSTVNMPFIYLEFDQICKIFWANSAYIEISSNGGANWSKVTGGAYQGSGNFIANGNKFSSVSYFDWDPGNDLSIPQDNWWRHEQFDISQLAANKANVQIRFVLAANSNGGLGNYGWLLDNIEVSGALGELVLPFVALHDSLVTDTLYHNGPYEITAEMSDASGIDTALLVWTLNGVTDTLGMDLIGYTTDNKEIRMATLPSYAFGTNFCYHIIAIDKSPLANRNTYPVSACEDVHIVRPFTIPNVGTGGANSYIAPMFNDSITDTRKYSQHVSLIKAQELNYAKGKIVKLAWNKTSTSAYLGSNASLKIYLKHTTSDSVNTTAGSFSNSKSGATLVFDKSNITLDSLMGWTDFGFNVDSFDYNGIQNLMVFVEWYRPSTLTKAQLRWQYSNTSKSAVSFVGSTASPTQVMGTNVRPNVRFYIMPRVFTYDAGIAELVSPQTLAYGQSVVVKIRNFGSDTINKLNIHYEVDGQSRPVYAFSGLILPDLNTNNIQLGTESLNTGAHIIKTWTSLPNDSLDQNLANDTLTRSFYYCSQALSGIYTVGGSGADFLDLTEVQNVLNYCGIQGPVTFRFNSGTYTDQISLENVQGTSATNTITFTSLSGNAADVVLVHNAFDSYDDYIFKIANTKYIQIQDLSLRVGGQLYSTHIRITDSVQFLTIENCILTTAVPASNSFGVQVYGQQISNITMKGNTFKNMRTAIQMSSYGGSSNYNIIHQNSFENIIQRAIYINAQVFMDISVNTIEMDPSSTYFTGIDISNGGVELNIYDNTINLNNLGSAKGIRYASTIASAGAECKVYNNMINIYGPSTNNTSMCLEVSNSAFLHISNNTFAMHTAGASSKAVSISTNVASSNITLLNNVFSHFKAGISLEVTNNSVNNNAIASCDNNAYYTNGATMVVWGTANPIAATGGPAALSAVNLMDSNSVFAEPMFYSNTNLHSFSPIINGGGRPISFITHDIDGNVRDSSTPDIGADEFNIAGFDAGILAIINPLPIDTQARSTNPMIVVRNIGTNAITSMIIGYEINGGTLQTYSFNGNIAPTAIDTIVLPSFSVPELDFSILAFTQLAGDLNTFNDSIFAHFYGLPLIDAELIAMPSPVDGCDMTATETVSVKIKNNGLNAISSGLSVSYQVVGSTTVNTETITANIAPGANYVHTFAAKVDLSVNGQDSIFIIRCFVNHATDPIQTNDTLNSNVLSLGILPAPIVSDTTINYGNTVTLYAQSNYNVEWYADSTSTNSLHSGAYYTTPNLFDTTTYYVQSNTNIPALTKFLGMDVTTNTAGSPNCVYDGGDGAKHQVLVLGSELRNMGIAAGNITSLAFYLESTTYNTPHAYFGIKMANTTVSSLTATRVNAAFATVFQAGFTEASGWNIHNFSTPFVWDGTSNVLIDLEIYTNYGDPQLRYSATSFNSVNYVTGSNQTGVTNERPNIRFTTDPVLGCVGIKTPITVHVPLAAIEASMAALVSPMGSCGLNSTPISCAIINRGTDTIPAGFTASYSVDSAAYITPEVVNLSIAPTDTLIYTFNTLASMPSGPNGMNHSISLAVSVPNDFFNVNDTLYIAPIFSSYTPSAPIIAMPPVANFGQSITVSATAADSVYWYGDSLGNIPLGIGQQIFAGPYYDTSYIYAQAQKFIPFTAYEFGTAALSNTSTVGPSPFGAVSYTSWGVKNQYLITADEMRSSGMLKGNIQSLAFSIKSVSGATHNNFTVSVGATNKSALTSFENNLTQVFTVGQFSEAAGWNTFTFNAPFYWDGHSNIVVQTCFKNSAWVTTGFAISDVMNTSNISSISTFSGGSFTCNDTLVKSSYNKRPRIKFVASGYSDCPSPMAKQRIDVQGIPSLDASIDQVVSPLVSANGSGSTPIVIVLKNYGTNPLTSVNIKWHERNQQVNTYAWTGNLAHGATDTVTIANHQFQGGTTRLNVWTNLPNGLNDTIVSNDTAFADLNVCMHGQYNIGIGMDYVNLQSALDDLLINSVCGPVILAIDSGNYLAQYTIPYINGVSASNTITITSIGNDSSTVQLSHGTPVGDNYVLRLLNAEHIIIRDLTFTSSGIQYANGIALEGTSKYIDIRSCVINSSNGTSSGAVASGVYCNDKFVSNVTVENNLINFGYHGIYFKADFNAKHQGISILNNTVLEFAKTGIYTFYVDSIIIKGNKLECLNGIAPNGIELRSSANYFQMEKNTIVLQPTSGSQGIYISQHVGNTANKSILANNAISVLNGSADESGLYVYNSSFINIAYNSVNILDGTPDNVGVEIAQGNGLRLLNNSIMIGEGYIVHIADPSVFSQCDYNNYYTDTLSNPKFVKFINDIYTIGSLKTSYPSYNAHSISVDPLYVSYTDLHANELLLNGGATPIAGITTDLDMELRSATTPDIGADEFTPSPIDLGAIYLSNPSTSGCGYSNAETILVKVRNFGTSTIDFSTQNATITFRSTGVNPDTITHIINTGTLASGATMDVGLSTPFDLSLTGLYVFDASTSIASDGNMANDAMRTMEFVSYQAITNLPFTEDFETGNSLYFGVEKNRESKVLINATAAATGSYGVQITGGDNTGFSPTNVSDAFSNTDHVGRLYSCNVDATSANTLSLRLDLKQTFYSVSTQCWFRVMITDQTGTYYAKNNQGDSTFRPITRNLDAFATHIFDLSAYAGQQISISMEAATGKSKGTSIYADDVFIDNILIWSPSPVDVGLKDIYSVKKGYDKTGAIHVPSVIVQNYGNNPISNIPVSYRVDLGTVLYDTLFVTLLPNQIDTVSLNRSFVVSAGMQQVRISTYAPGDAVASNDTIVGELKGLNRYFLDYVDDLEGGNQFFAKGIKSQWQLGTPNSTHFTSAYSGTKAWATRLTTNYLTEAVEYLYTPYFRMPTSNDTVEIEFMQQMRVQNTFAYGYIQYSFDGQLWIDLGYIGMPNSSNWYATNINNKHVWGQNRTWVKSSAKLDPSQFNGSGDIQFRFVFQSLAAANTADGWSIDDFKISLQKQQFDAGVTQIVRPDSTMTGSSNVVEVSIFNYGTDTLRSIPLSYKATGQTAVMETWTGILAPSATVNYTFTAPLVGPAANYQLCAYTRAVADIRRSNDTTCKNVVATLPFWDAAVVDVKMLYGTPNQVQIKVLNKGLNTITSIPLTFSVNSFQSTVVTPTINLISGDTLTYVFTETPPSPLGAYLLCGNADLPLDLLPANNDLCISLTSVQLPNKNELILNQNRPNPFTNTTEISYVLPNAGKVLFSVVNVLGKVVYKEVYTETALQNTHQYNFNHLAPGIYYYSIEFDGQMITKKMVIQ